MDFELKEGNKSKYSNLAIRDFIERLPLWPGSGASGWGAEQGHFEHHKKKKKSHYEDVIQEVFPSEKQPNGWCNS